MRRIFVSLLGGLAISAFAPVASATTLSFSCITNNSAADCGIGASQLSVDVTDIGDLSGSDLVEFRVLNVGSAQAIVKEVYFDVPGGLLTGGRLIDKDDGTGGHSGVDFTYGSANPGNLPGGNAITPKFKTTPGFLADTDKSVHNGVNPGEWLAFVFLTQDFSNLLSELATGGLRIGLHVGAFAGGGSESFVSNPPSPVPLPAAGWLMLSALAPWLALKRRRSARNQAALQAA